MGVTTINDLTAVGSLLTTDKFMIQRTSGDTVSVPWSVLQAGGAAGLGTMASQNANAVAITGGAINGTTIGATSASTGAFTTLLASTTSTAGLTATQLAVSGLSALSTTTVSSLTASQLATLSAGLTVTGAATTLTTTAMSGFTSTQAGSITGALTLTGGINSGSASGSVSVNGGANATGGGSIQTFGGTHANANQVRVLNGTTVVSGWDNSGNAWFGGAVAAGSLKVNFGAAFNRQVTVTGSDSGNPSISVTGGTLEVGANAWTFGIANSVSPTSPNRTLTVTIGGTTYYIAAKTTND